MSPPSKSDKAVPVSAYLTDQTFGYDHWRAAQFGAPTVDKYGILLLYDTREERDAAFKRCDPDKRTGDPAGKE